MTQLPDVDPKSADASYSPRTAETRLMDSPAMASHHRSGKLSSAHFLIGIPGIDSLFDPVGLPLGNIIEISADSGVGRTTVALEVVRSFLLAGHRCVYLDADNGLNGEFLRRMSLASWIYNPETNSEGPLRVFRASTFEKCEEAVRKYFIDDPSMRILVVDSLSAANAEEFFQLPLGSSPAGHRARLEGRFAHKLRYLIDCRPCPTVVLLLARRHAYFWKEGMKWSPGSRSVSSKKTLESCDVRLRLSVLGPMGGPGIHASGENKTPVGSKVLVEVTKSEWTGRRATLSIYFGSGIR